MKKLNSDDWLYLGGLACCMTALVILLFMTVTACKTVREQAERDDKKIALFEKIVDRLADETPGK